MRADMMANSANPSAADPNAPVNSFSQCHAGILSGLQALAGLPELAAAAERSRLVATATVAMFDQAVESHHADEENDLFPAVVRSAAPGQERARVQGMVEQLTAEHRAVEALWKKLKPVVKQAAAGSRADFEPNEVAELVDAYSRHARFEETEFLPLARDILGRDGNHMAALALSLHLRHAPQPVGYI